MIEVINLSKNYGDKRAVDNISFTINEGEIVGFLGPNGAGKSTTMNILTGYISASDGTAKIGGIDVLKDPIAAKKKIGYLPEQPPLYMDMTVNEYLNFIYDLKKVELPKDTHLDEICNQTGISHVRKRMIRNLSKGYKQRVGLAQAMVGNPEILILDEPTIGLDPIQIIEIRNVIKELGKKRTVILSSHILPEVQAVCERIIVISRGKIVADGTAEGLSHDITGDRKLVLRVAGERDKVLKVLKGLDGILEVTPVSQKEPESYDFIVESRAGVDIRKPMFRALHENSMPVLMLKSMDLTLEEIFLKLTIGETVELEGKNKKQADAERDGGENK